MTYSAYYMTLFFRSQAPVFSSSVPAKGGKKVLIFSFLWSLSSDLALSVAASHTSSLLFVHKQSLFAHLSCTSLVKSQVPHKISHSTYRPRDMTHVFEFLKQPPANSFVGGFVCTLHTSSWETDHSIPWRQLHWIVGEKKSLLVGLDKEKAHMVWDGAWQTHDRSYRTCLPLLTRLIW